MGRITMITYAKCSDGATSACTGFGTDDDHVCHLFGGMVNTPEVLDYGAPDRFRSGDEDCKGYSESSYGCYTMGFDKGPDPKRSRRSRKKSA